MKALIAALLTCASPALAQPEGSTHLSLGAGTLALGISINGGHRFGEGWLVEGGVGMASGHHHHFSGYVGAGYSLAVFSGSWSRLEVPFLATGGAWVEEEYYENVVSPFVGGLTGLDWLVGSGDLSFFLSLRLGLAAYHFTEPLIGDEWGGFAPGWAPLPVGQLGLGVAF